MKTQVQNQTASSAIIEDTEKHPSTHTGTLYLLRGIPGGGKTTHAKTLGIPDHFEADQWFEKNGGYDAAKIKPAHAWCQREAMAAMKDGRDVVVSNTFIRLWEMKPYLDAAKACEHHVIVKVMRGKWKNVHGVPESVVRRMTGQFEWNI